MLQVLKQVCNAVCNFNFLLLQETRQHSSTTCTCSSTGRCSSNYSRPAGVRPYRSCSSSSLGHIHAHSSLRCAGRCCCSSSSCTPPLRQTRQLQQQRQEQTAALLSVQTAGSGNTKPRLPAWLLQLHQRQQWVGGMSLALCLEQQQCCPAHLVNSLQYQLQPADSSTEASEGPSAGMASQQQTRRLLPPLLLQPPPQRLLLHLAASHHCWALLAMKHCTLLAWAGHRA